MVNIFADRFLWEKIRKDKTTRKFMKDPDYKKIIEKLVKEPKKLR